MKLKFALIFALAIISVSCNGSPASPTAVSELVPSVTPQKTVEIFVPFKDADPQPLPSGLPQANCGKPLTVSGTLEVQLSAVPGGTPIQVYLAIDSGNVGCGPNNEVCADAIDPVTFTGSVSKSWNVTPGKYCIVMRNRSSAVQILNGSMVFQH